MGTLCSGGKGGGMRLRVNEHLRAPKGDQHRLRAQEMDECPSNLAARPITPAYRLNRNGRRGWCLFNGWRHSFRLGDWRNTS
jgi:hypothetical protein